MAECKWCGQDKKLIKAHIIPKAFWNQIIKNRNNGEPDITTAYSLNEYPKRRPQGEYDKNLLCLDCEVALQKYDDYLVSFLLNRNHKEVTSTIKGKPEAIYLSPSDICLDSITKSLLFILWRAHYSPTCPSVELGKYETIFREILADEQNVKYSDYPFFLTKFSPPLFITDPFKRRIDKISFYQISLGSYEAYIKVDKQKAPHPFERVQRKIQSSNRVPFFKNLYTHDIKKFVKDYVQ